MTTYTPGPWVTRAITCDNIGHHVRIAKFHPGAGAYQIIADCSYEATRGMDCEANARLIAEAPTMLDFIRHIAEHSIEDIARREARAILARIDHHD
jgi:hypothetical protein